MNAGLPNIALPWYVIWTAEAFCWTFEKRRWLLLLLVPLLCLAAAAVARANCGTIPDRQEALCIRLGFDGSPCDVEWERDRRGRLRGGWGELTLTSDTDVDEPLAGSLQPTTATVLRFKTRRARLTKIYSPTNPDYNGLDKQPGDAPCVVPRCTVNQGIYGLDDYLGLDEWALLDVANVLDKLLFNPPDERFVERLREAHGAVGLPVAIEAWDPRLHDESETELASELRIRVRWFFALPAR